MCRNNLKQTKGFSSDNKSPNRLTKAVTTCNRLYRVEIVIILACNMRHIKREHAVDFNGTTNQLTNILKRSKLDH